MQLPNTYASLPAFSGAVMELILAGDEAPKMQIFLKKYMPWCHSGATLKATTDFGIVDMADIAWCVWNPRHYLVVRPIPYSLPESEPGFRLA